MTDRSLKRRIKELLTSPEGDERPILLFLAGPNGAGKSTLFKQLKQSSSRSDFLFINADHMAVLMGGIPEPDVLAQKVAELAREHLLKHPVTFATETVFSDEVGAKLDYLRRAAAAGFRVVFVYVALSSWALSAIRVGIREDEGGHGVERSKFPRRYKASAENARRALNFVEVGLVFENSDAERPFQPMAITANGQLIERASFVPRHVAELLPTATSGTAKPPAAEENPGKPPDLQEPRA